MVFTAALLCRLSLYVRELVGAVNRGAFFYPTLPASKFSQVQANQYMEFVLTGRNTNEVRQEWRKLENGRVSPRTYNNNIKLGRAFFSWAVEKSYARINPFEKLKPKRAQGKIARLASLTHPPEYQKSLSAANTLLVFL